MRFLLFIIVLVGLLILVSRTPMLRGYSGSGAKTEGPAEQAGRAVDKAFHKAGEAIEDLGERIQENTEVRPTSAGH